MVDGKVTEATAVYHTVDIVIIMPSKTSKNNKQLVDSNYIHQMCPPRQTREMMINEDGLDDDNDDDELEKVVYHA